MEYSFNTLLDVIEHAEKYKNRKRPRSGSDKQSIPFNGDMERLTECLKPLKKLYNLVGMEELKKNIVDQILFYSQELNTNEMMHTCLTGPPGVGKTTLGKILAEIYCSLGFLSTDNFKVVTSADLIAGYIGQTALKTRKVLKSSLGGVLFIDEAYSIGSAADADSKGYSKECLDTINAFLSENTSDFIMIIAGYSDDLERHFFSFNPGLKRRFPWVYDIKKYSGKDLREIFCYQVNESEWYFEDSITDEILNELFNEYSAIFTENGGDTLILFDKAKICHSRRVFGKKKKYKRVLNMSDIRTAAELLKSHKNKKVKDPPFGMYV